MKKKCQNWKMRNVTICTDFFDVLFKTIKTMPAKTACEEANFCAKKVENEYDSFLDNGLSYAAGEINLESLTDDKSCKACQSFYESLKKSHIKVNNSRLWFCD
jgi:hypothetical protein